MTRALQLQGLTFSVVALVLAAVTAAAPRFPQRFELIAAAVAIVTLGVPHGGLDMVFARELHGMRGILRWAAFGLLYGFLAASVVAVWLAAPAVFLISFLLVSAVHFSGDPARGTLTMSRVLYGGAVIVLPAALHAGETGQLFGLLAGDDAASMLMPWLTAISLPWLAVLATCAVIEVRRSPCTALELVAVGTLAVATPPLVAFVVFFCGMHSVRHVLRTAEWVRRSGRWLMVASALLPTAAVLAVAVGGWFWMGDTPPNARIIRLVFVGLAALTVPHMALVERVRLNGWRPIA